MDDVVGECGQTRVGLVQIVDGDHEVGAGHLVLPRLDLDHGVSAA